ncbi:unnamed protein product [Symbiodinium sp. CCMP2592]|nr:unnamed protein product [Symbiodinium sp. CCMP2592]
MAEGWSDGMLGCGVQGGPSTATHFERFRARLTWPRTQRDPEDESASPANSKKDGAAALFFVQSPAQSPLQQDRRSPPETPTEMAPDSASEGVPEAAPKPTSSKDIALMNVRQLQAECRQEGLRVRGNKAELLRRLREARGIAQEEQAALPAMQDEEESARGEEAAVKQEAPTENVSDRKEKATTPFLHFYRAIKNTLTAKGCRGMMREASARFKSLSDEDRAPYEKMQVEEEKALQAQKKRKLVDAVLKDTQCTSMGRCFVKFVEQANQEVQEVEAKLIHVTGTDRNHIKGFFCVDCVLVYRALDLAGCPDCRQSVCRVTKCLAEDKDVYLVDRPGMLLPAETDIEDFRLRPPDIMVPDTLKHFLPKIPKGITIEEEAMLLLGSAVDEIVSSLFHRAHLLNQHRGKKELRMDDFKLALTLGDERQMLDSLRKCQREAKEEEEREEIDKAEQKRKRALEGPKPKAAAKSRGRKAPNASRRAWADRSRLEAPAGLNVSDFMASRRAWADRSRLEAPAGLNVSDFMASRRAWADRSRLEAPAGLNVSDFMEQVNRLVCWAQKLASRRAWADRSRLEAQLETRDVFHQGATARHPACHMPKRPEWRPFDEYTHVLGQRPAGAADDLEERFRLASKAWMASFSSRDDGACLGKLSTAWEAQQKLKANMFCMECTGCHAGKGRRFRAECSLNQDDDTVRLQILVAGECSGQARVLRESLSDQPPTVTERRRLKIATALVAAEGEEVTPSHVARRMAAQGSAPTMNAQALRHQVRGFDPAAFLRPRRQNAPPVTGVADWQRCLAEHRDADAGLLCFVVSPPSGSFVATLPPMLNHLAAVHQANYLGMWTLSADCTFRVEVGRWVYLMVTASVHRLLSDRWRVALRELQKELERRDVPMPCQIHTDHFPGLRQVCKATFPSSRHVPGMEHMFRNFAKSEIRDRETGEPLRVPRLASRPLPVVIGHLHRLARVPTLSLFMLLASEWLQRMTHEWPDPDFAAYLRRQYFHEGPVDAQIYGIETGLKASFWYGHASKTVAGHPPSQQQSEASHRQFKRIVGKSPNDKLPAVIERCKSAVALWSSVSTSTEASYGLVTPSGNTGGVPLSPDLWMVQRDGTGLWRHHLPGSGTVIVPAVWRIHDDVGRTPSCVVEDSFSTGRCFIMRTGTPGPVDSGHARQMMAQLRTRNVPQLKALLQQHGVLLSVANELAPWKISFPSLDRFWTEHCVVIYRSRSGQPAASSQEQIIAGDIVQCTCWYHLRKGHCPHQYYVQERLGLRVHSAGVLPTAAAARVSLEDDGSSRESRRTKVRKRLFKKKRRAEYRPRAVLPLQELLEEKEDASVPAPKRLARVLPAQRAAR